VQLVSSSLKHSGRLSRAGIELLGRIVSRHHERVGWDRPPRIGDGIAERVIAKAANTDTWNPDAPVFLAPALARAIRVEQPPDYRETRLYVPPDGDGSRSMLLAANNVGHVMLREGELTHRLLARTSSGTRMHEATMATGNDVLAALNGRTAHA
jgi:hypothetical protein